MNENVIHIFFKLHTYDHIAKGVALLNSGAIYNFMDRRMVKQLQLGSKPLAIPRSIRNVNGTNNKNGTLTRYTDLEVSIDQNTQVQQFYITNLIKDHTLFSFP